MMTTKRIPWEVYYEMLFQIYKENGTVNLSFGKTYVVNGLAIGRWISRQRNVYSIGKMSKERIEKLEKLGFVWDGNNIRRQKESDNWNQVFLLAKKYYEENGNLRIPRNYVIEGVDVGSWLSNLKTAYKGKNRRTLTDYQISKLESIGVEWDFDYAADRWERMYLCAKDYMSCYGNIFIVQGVDYKGLPLGNWIHDQRQLYKKGKLSEERINKLDELGIRWNPHSDKWEAYYKCAKKYYKEIGNLDVPYDFEVDGLTLGRWISVQRQSYNGRHNTILTKTQIKKLELIGMLWKGSASTQTSFYEQVIYYYLLQKYPTAVNRYKNEGFELDIFIPELRMAIEYDGFYWHKDKLERDNAKDLQCKEHLINLIRIRENQLPKTIFAKCYILDDASIQSFQNTLCRIFTDCFGGCPIIDIKKDCFDIVRGYKLQITSPWYQAFLEAKSYYEKFGSLLVPKDYKSSSGLNLYSWIKNQRQAYKCNTRPLSVEQITLLDGIGMAWGPNDDSWERGYSYARMYFEEYGNLLVPGNLDYKGFKLGKWIQSQRVHRDLYIERKKERICRLERIGMVWNSITDAWDKGFQVAKKYFETHGDLLVSSTHITSCGFKLGQWIQTQRNLKKDLYLSDVQHKIMLLDTIGMVWDVLEYQWNQGINYARMYYNLHGNLLVPQNYILDDFRLGAWVGNLRESRKKNKISEVRLKQLESLGMVWNTKDYSWEKHYSLACEYYNVYGSINIPSRTIYKGVDLGTWLKNIRNAKKRGRKSYLTDERVLLMEKIGMVW